jgi:hypothetical protein
MPKHFQSRQKKSFFKQFSWQTNPAKPLKSLAFMKFTLIFKDIAHFVYFVYNAGQNK